MAEEGQNKPSYYQLINPLLASCVKTTLLCPFDRCQLVLQTQSLNVQVQNYNFPQYKNALDYFKRIIRVESPILMWRGNMIQIVQRFLPFIPKLPILFIVDPLQALIDKSGMNSHRLYNELYLLGAASLVYPIDLIRIRVMSDIGPSREFNGFFDCESYIRQIDGPRGFYRGLVPHLVGLAFYRASYISGYKVVPRNKQKSLTFQFLHSQLIIIVSGLIAYPCMTVQRQMIMQSARNEILFDGLIDCINKIYATGGVRQFYRGYMVSFCQMFFTIGLGILLV